jgi:hypothetical protein
MNWRYHSLLIRPARAPPHPRAVINDIKMMMCFLAYLSLAYLLSLMYGCKGNSERNPDFKFYFSSNVEYVRCVCIEFQKMPATQEEIKKKIKSYLNW